MFVFVCVMLFYCVIVDDVCVELIKFGYDGESVSDCMIV